MNTDHRESLDESAQFDWMLTSSLELPAVSEWRHQSLADMLTESDADVDHRSLLIGNDHHGPMNVSLSDLRVARQNASAWCAQQGYAAGDSLLLVRLPHSSEVPLATAAIALMSLGVRVVLPMSFDRGVLTEIAKQADARAMLWCADLASDTSLEQVRQADRMFREVATELGIPTFSLDGQLDWHLGEPTDTANAQPKVDQPDQPEREVLVLSTSGSTGQPKLVRYTDMALLKVAEAWNAAGLMDESTTGGRSICPALSHSMGFRNVLHAVWNRCPTLLAQTEWLEEKPKQYVKLLQRCQPQHITCGPAYLGDLGLLASSVTRVRDALSSLEVIVSSGAPEVNIERVLPGEVRTANAFGMTELQQVLNTLLGSSSVRGALGRPLPGVSVAVRYVDKEQRVGRLFVSSPFGARGYLGQADFDHWFETGDLVRVEGDDLVWVGRQESDFLNTGHGVKVSGAELRVNYSQLLCAAEAVVFVGLPRRGGVGAIVYLNSCEADAPETHRLILEAIEEDHRRMAQQNRDFALNYMAISVVGCVSERPPKSGPGKLDEREAIHQQEALIAAMDHPVPEHPQVVTVPPYGSDRPDWRRFAAGNP